MMHVDGFDMDGAIAHKGGLHLIGTTKNDMIEAHHGTFCGSAAVGLVMMGPLKSITPGVGHDMKVR